MECELLLLQPRLLPAWLARFEPSKENAAFRANREARTSHPRLAVCAKCCAWLITDLQCSSLRGRRLKGNGKGVLGAGETPEAREEGGRETPARRPLACVASVSVRFGSKERGTRVKHRAKNGLSKRAGRGFHFSRGQTRESRSSVFLCSETKRKRLLRRLGDHCFSRF